MPETAIVFVHGWSANSNVWFNQMNFFGTQYRVVAVDLPGHRGEVPAPFALKLPDTRRSTRAMEECGIQLAELLERENLKSAHLVGWSLGGQVVCQAVLAGGAAPKSLTLVGANPCFIVRNGEDWGQNPTKLKWFRKMLNDDFNKGCAAFVKSFLDHEKRIDQAELARIVGMIMDFPPEKGRALEILDDFYASDLRPKLAGLRIPTYVIHGALDRISPPGAVELWKAAPGFKGAAIMKNCGHAPFLTEPEEFNNMLDRFIKHD